MRIEDARVRDSREPRHEASASHHRRRRRSRAADTTAHITAPAGDCYGARGTSCASGRRPCGTPASPRRSRRTCGRAPACTPAFWQDPYSTADTATHTLEAGSTRGSTRSTRRAPTSSCRQATTTTSASPSRTRTASPRPAQAQGLPGQHRRDRAVPVHVRLVESGGRQRHYLRRPATRPQATTVLQRPVHPSRGWDVHRRVFSGRCHEARGQAAPRSAAITTSISSRTLSAPISPR